MHSVGHTLTNMVMRLHAIQSVIEIEPVRAIKEVREVMHQARNGKKGVQRWIMILREEPMHLARGRSRFKEQRPSSPPGYEKIGHFYLDTWTSKRGFHGSWTELADRNTALVRV